MKSKIKMKRETKIESTVHDLDTQVLAILNSTLLDNLLMHIQPNTKALSAHL